MVTAKIGGIARPCTNRQKMSGGKVGASATMTVGTTSTNSAVTMTRLRPSTSATAPVKGAVSATASVLAVMMAEISRRACAELAATASAGSPAASRD